MKVKNKKKLFLLLIVAIVCSLFIGTICYATAINGVESYSNSTTVTWDYNVTDEENSTNTSSSTASNATNSSSQVENEATENNTNSLTSDVVDKDGNVVDTISEDEATETEETVTTTSVKKSTRNEDVYEFSTSSSLYKLEDNVNGNVFIAGSNDVEINSDYIKGDIYIVANTITIDENVAIDGNVYLAGQEIEINGTLYRTAYIAGKTVTFGEQSSVEYDTMMAGTIININGQMMRNVYLYAEKINFGENATIVGNLNYEANEEAEIADGTVLGEVSFEKIVTEEKSTAEIIMEYALDLLKTLIFVLCVFIAILLISRKFTYRSQEFLGKHIFKSIGIGLFGLIVVPIVAIILMAMGVTIKVGLVLIPIYILMVAIANAITIISISSLIVARSKGMKLPIVVPLITIAVWAIESIPYIGTIALFFSIVIGIGILLQNVFSSNKPISKGEINENKR